MKASEFAGLVTFIIFILGGYIGTEVDKYIGLTICVAALVWYFKKGAYLRGYLTQQSETSMRKEAAAIEELSRTWLRPEGTEVPNAERGKLLRRRRELLSKLATIEEEASGPW